MTCNPKSKRRHIWLLSAGLFALLLVASLGVTPALAQPPSLPHQFYGKVTINGTGFTTGSYPVIRFLAGYE